VIDTLMPLIKQFLPFAQERMGFKYPPKLFLRGDDQNAKNPLGKTAFYNPDAKAVTLYVTGRHPKDVMRSLSHELVHHTQNCNGQFKNAGEMGEGYAQNDEHLREMEREAYETGNMCFRDWEDSIKNTIYYESLQKDKGVTQKMLIKDWKNREISTLLSEAWGFKFNTLQEFDEFNGTGEIQEDTGGTGGELDPEEAEKEETGKPYVSKREEEGLEGLEEGTEETEEEITVTEDSGGEEGEHYEHSSMHDEDHIKAIRHHLDALEHDKDYDEKHVDEGGRANRRENEAEGEERRMKTNSAMRERKYTHDQLKEALRKVIRHQTKRNKNG
tara:strand:- start:3224 stop:4210 length:987 start_codon:yes stop_codon:yes gene_type:complete